MKIVHLIIINTIALIVYLLYFFLPVVIILGENYSQYIFMIFNLSLFMYGGFLILFSIIPVAKLILLEKKLIDYNRGTTKLNVSVIEDDLIFIIISIVFIKMLWILLFYLRVAFVPISGYSTVIILFPFYFPFLTIGLLSISYMATRSLKEDAPPIITNEIIDKIKEEYRDGISLQELAEKYNVSMIKIAKIVKEKD